MKKTKYIFIGIILSVSIQFIACGTEGSPTDLSESNGYRTELTEEEMEGGHVSFQMDGNLVVDADVTPKEKYEKGLSSYYLKLFCETDKASEKEFFAEPTVSFHTFEEWKGMLNKILPGKFKDSTFKINKKDADIRQIYQVNNGTLYAFDVNWSNYTKGVEEGTGFNSPVITFGIDLGNMLYNKATNIREYVRDYHGSDKMDFLQGGEEIEHMKEFLQEMTGRHVYEEYDFSVASKETIHMLNAVHPWMEEEAPEEEYAVFYFYYDIDGLPFRDLKLDYIMDNNMTATDLCYWSSVPGNRLTGLSEHEQVLVTSKDGILYLDCSNIWDAGEVYQENLPVVTPNEALKQIKERYSRQLLKEECTVTDIALVYTGYFSDGEDGKIQPIVSPFWAIKVYDGDAGMHKYFVYDAYTGECIREG